MKTKEKDEKYFGRGKPSQDLEVLRTEGSFIFDNEGKKYVDFLGGAGVGALGWNKPEIEEALKNPNRPSYVYPNFRYKPWADLAELLAEITPEHLVKSFRTTGGSEAVEAAMEMAMMYTKRKKFISIEGAYHGNTMGALSLGTSKNKDKFPNLLSDCEKIEPPLNQESLDKIENLLKKEDVAAFIMEPIIVNLGVIVPEKSFMKKLNELCKKYGTLLVMDEAITGFGRTGRMFASEHFEIKPDIICMAKALSAGHAGIGALICTQEIAQTCEEKVGLYSSYGWHPVSVDVALATLHYIKNYETELLENVEKMEQLFVENLEKIDFKTDAEIRSKGLAVSIDVKDEEYASEIKKKALEAGLLMNTEGSSLGFLPALNIEEDVVLEGLQILKEVVEK